MCYHKSFVVKVENLLEHYQASFESITSDLELIKERFSIIKAKDEKVQPYTKDEIDFMKWCDKTLMSFGETEIKRFHENGFDFLPSPIVTLGKPDEFKLFRWGLIPFWVKDYESAKKLRIQTLNCISEEMYDKSSLKDAAKNNQRCLIPATSFFEWRWMDEKGKVKIPYNIGFDDHKLFSIAGLYSRWKDKATDEYIYTYTVLTTEANPLMAKIHNSKKRMPVIIPREYEKDWLNPNLTKEDVLALCKPIPDNHMTSQTIAKLITTKNVETNVPEVLSVQSYQELSSE
jgi:putative SOS response-associated peptidase YedK